MARALSCLVRGGFRLVKARAHVYRLAAIGTAVAALLSPAAAEDRDPVTILAASSLTDAAGDIARAWQEAGHPPLRLSFAASSALARQIEAGAPAHIFISADTDWMTYLAGRGLIDPSTVVPFAGNALALVAAQAPARPFTVRDPSAWTGLLGPDGRLAMGDPDYVPVGKYAKESLQSRGLWTVLEPRIARAENVRAALSLVSRGEAPAGIVYRTDARLAPSLAVVAELPLPAGQEIAYPLGLTAIGSGDERARAAAAFLTGASAQTILSAYGFSIPAEMDRSP